MSINEGINNQPHIHNVGSISGEGMPSEASSAIDSPPLSAGKSAAAETVATNKSNLPPDSPLQKAMNFPLELIDTNPDHEILKLLNSELPKFREESLLINLGMASAKFFVSKE